MSVRKRRDLGEPHETLRTVSESVRSLSGGEAQARIFLQHFYPHEARLVDEGERLSRDSVDRAIGFLRTVCTELRGGAR